jgi:hypothetical protein
MRKFSTQLRSAPPAAPGSSLRGLPRASFLKETQIRKKVLGDTNALQQLFHELVKLQSAKHSFAFAVSRVRARLPNFGI